MQSAFRSGTLWDGQLPPHIVKNEQIWWELVPRFTADLRPKLFGGYREQPSQKTIGSVGLVAWTKANLNPMLRGLLNDWGCYCQYRMDGPKVVYMAGTCSDPRLVFSCQGVVFPTLILRFDNRIDQNQTVAEMEKQDSSIRDMLLKDCGSVDQIRVSIQKYKTGDWEHGLDIASRAAIWLLSNRDEALARIWKGTAP